MIVNRRSIYILRLLSDLILLNIAFLLAAGLSQSIDILIPRYYMFFLLVGLNFLWILLSNISGFYDDFHSRNFPFQFINILKEAAAQVIASIIFIFLAKEDLFTRNFIIIYTVLLIFFISVRTIVFRKVLKSLRRKGKNIRNLLIIGTGEVAYNFKNMISSNPDFGYQFIGFATTENIDSANDVIGSTHQLEKLISEFGIDEVVIVDIVVIGAA